MEGSSTGRSERTGLSGR